MNISTINLPKARDQKIVVQDFDGDTLVYDLKNDEAHHLNKTASIVWGHCDGKTKIIRVCELLSNELNTKIEADFISIALEELNKIDLLEIGLQKDHVPKVSRRKVLFKYALPAVSLPVVMSLIAPTSVHAQSCAGLGGACNTSGTPCCIGSLVCGGTHSGPGVCSNPGCDRTNGQACGPSAGGACCIGNLNCDDVGSPGNFTCNDT